MPFALPYRMFFLRHGETSWNVEGRLQGQRDIPGLRPRAEPVHGGLAVDALDC